MAEGHLLTFQVGAPLDAHPVFAPLRLGLLSNETLLHVVRITLRSAFHRTNRGSELLLVRALHLLTLAAHVAQASGPSPFTDALMDLIRAEEAGRKRTEAEASEQASGAGSSSSGAASSAAVSVSDGGRSLLSLLMALPEVCKDDKQMCASLRWLVDTFAALDPKCQAVIQAATESAASSVKDDAEQRKRAREHQQKMREQYKAKLNKFAMTAEFKEYEEMGDDDDIGASSFDEHD
jgi:hypothetical protein